MMKKGEGKCSSRNTDIPLQQLNIYIICSICSN